MAAHILVCDDDANLRESIRDNLELDGYEVVEAGMGGDAVAAVTKQSFDVILMDYNLPDMTGIDAIHKIREINTESQILMLTAHASLDTALKAIQEAVYDFLVKPVDFDHLKRVIAKSVDRLALQQENRRLVDDLRKANEQMLYLSNMKSKFLSMASHDLSNVLMTLQVSFEMLSGSMTPDGEQKKRMGYISNGLAQLARLIEDLVDWASIEQGKFRLEREPHAPGSIVTDAVGAISARAAQRGVNISHEVEKDLPKINVDKRRLSQVLGNLLENALRHTQKKGSVRVCVARNKRGLLFSVQDSGEGIEPQDLKRIFESFYQSSGKGSQGRLGLGLSISREIIHSHGGEIWVESKGHGKGASFLFTIPEAAKS
ncbi:MAG: ATP-binding protein [Elusimicrobiota bacterium]